MMPTFADLFSGAGLFSGAFAASGFDPIFAAEGDARAVASYNRNIAPVAVHEDVRRVQRWLKCKVLIAGPPCQCWSTLGKRDAGDERTALPLLVAPWARATKAQVVLVENVPQFVESPQWRKLVSDMLVLRYEHVVWMLDAADYGAPQRRRRAFTIFSRVGLPQLPAPIARTQTVRDAFRGLPKRARSAGMHSSPIPSALALRRFRFVPPEGDKRDIIRDAPDLCPPSWAKMGQQATDVWGRLAYDKPSNTLRCCFQNPSKGRYIHPTENRVITLREGARLQGVPDHWTFSGDRTSVARQIGNGVPFQLGMAVARSVRDLFK